MTDIVTDILDRITRRTGKLKPDIARSIESEVREDWGGERHYIAKIGESGREQLAERDRRILADFRRGEHVELLSRRYCISTKRVQQIISAGNGLP